MPRFLPPPSSDETAPAPARRRGRPPGRLSGLEGEQALLRLHHFHFVRAALEVPLRAAWQRYLAFSGGPDDERHFAARLRQLVRQIGAAAGRRGLGALADVGLHRHRLAAAGVPAPPPQLQVPPLEDWIAARCEALGIEADFQSQAEWLAEYSREFGLDRPHVPAGATVLAEAGPEATAAARGPTLRDQLQALHRLAAELACAPALDDALEGWLRPALAQALRHRGVASLRELIDFLNRQGHCWHRDVPGIGADRARRIVAWLAPLAEQLGLPLQPRVLHSATALALARRAAEPAPVRSGLVPLERLAGPKGSGQAPPHDNAGAASDLEALQAWLQRAGGSPRTRAAYRQEVERFHLWCLHEARKPFAGLTAADLQAYSDFLARPPAHWVQSAPAGRDSDAWRPLRGPLAPASRRRALRVVSLLLGALAESGHLRANVARGAAAGVTPPPPAQTASGFDAAQWQLVLRTLAGQPDTAFSRRTRLVLALGAGCGLSLGELVAARLGDLREPDGNGTPAWRLELGAGPGRRARSVPLDAALKALIDRHQQDLDAAGVLPPDLAPARRPLVGALRPPPPRWTLDARGSAVLDRGARRAADPEGALEPSALYQSLKRLFARAARQAPRGEGEDDAATEALRQASTRWLRRFFVCNASAAPVPAGGTQRLSFPAPGNKPKQEERAVGLMDFIKKQFIDIIEWTEAGDGVLAWRFPVADREIQYGASLTVRESQMAVFVNEGRVADVFGPGMYKLSTQTLPVLTYLKNWDKLFQSPFKSDVYFFSTRQQVDRRWGTTQPVTIRDKDFGAVRLRAFGNYAFRVADPKRFHTEVSGTRETYTVEDLDGQLRGLMLQHISDAVAGSGVPFLDLAANQVMFAGRLREATAAAFEAIGLKLELVTVQNVSLPEELQKVLDQKIGMGMVGNDMGRFMQYQTAQAIPAMAAAAGTGGGSIAGDAMGLGAGLALGQVLAQQLGQGLQQGAAPQAAAAAAAAVPPAAATAGVRPEEVMATLEKLGELKAKGILTEEEFSAKKAELLKKLV